MESSSESKVFAVKTVVGREKEAAEMINGQNDYNNYSLISIVVSFETEGYIYVEADDVADVLRATENVRLAREVLERPAPEEDVDKIIHPRPHVAKVSYGSSVLITDGGFKGEEGEVKNVMHEEETVTVELDTTAVPISVTVDMDLVKPV